MFKKLLFIVFIALSVMSCEEPVHEEYDLYGNSNDTNDGNGTWFPLAIDNEWNFSGTEITDGNFTDLIKIENTEVIDGKTYFKLHQGVTNSSETYDDFSYVRWDNNTFEHRMIPDLYGMNDDLTATPFILHTLKQNMTVGMTWSETVTSHLDYIGLDISFDINFTYNYLYEQHYDTLIVNGTIFNDIAKVKTLIDYNDPMSGINFQVIEYTYYAKNIGIIKTVSVQNGLEAGQMNITSYTIH